MQKLRTFVFCVQQCIVILFINLANHAPGVQTGHILGVSLSAIGKSTICFKVHFDCFFDCKIGNDYYTPFDYPVERCKITVTVILFGSVLSNRNGH